MSQPPEDQGPGPSSDSIAEREAHIARLEQELARPKVGVLPPIAAIGVLGACFLASQLWGDVSYFFSPREPIEPGAEGPALLAIEMMDRQQIAAVARFLLS